MSIYSSRIITHIQLMFRVSKDEGYEKYKKNDNAKFHKYDL